MDHVDRSAPAGAEQSHAQTQRVLVLDGSSDAHAQSVKPVLDSGNQCVATTSVEGALNSLEQNVPGMVLCDPSTSGGWQACEQMSERLKEHAVPLVLMVRADAPAELVEVGQQAGADDCILRPLRLQHINSRLSALARRGDGACAVPRAEGRVVVVGRDRAFVERLDAALELDGYRVLCVAPDHALSVAALVPPDEDCLVLLCQDAGSRYDDLLAAFARRGNPPGKPTPPIVRVADSVEAPRHPEDSPFWRAADVFGLDAIVGLVNSHFRRRAGLIPRAHARAPFFCPVELREIDGPTPTWLSGYSNDLSPFGISVRSVVPPRARACVDLRIYLTTFREMIEVKCVVAWSNPWVGRGAWSWQVGAGLQFMGKVPPRLLELSELCSAEVKPHG